MPAVILFLVCGFVQNTSSGRDFGAKLKLEDLEHEDEEPDSLTKDEMGELDQHEGVSFLACETFPYCFIMPNGFACTAWDFIVLGLVLVRVGLPRAPPFWGGGCMRGG